MRELEHAHERLDGLREVVADLLGEGVERVAHHALPHELERSSAHPRQDVDVLRTVFDLTLERGPQLKPGRIHPIRQT